MNTLFRRRRTFYKRVGDCGEAAAARLLRAQGMEVLAHNFRYKRNEIDLVMRDGVTLCFVEVKTFLGTHRKRRPMEKLLYRQKQRIIRASKVYRLKLENARHLPVRYDGVEVILKRFGPFFFVSEIVHHVDCFGTLR